MEKRSFVEKCAPPPCNHPPPLPPGPLVIPGKIGFTFRRELVCAHISFLRCVLLRTPIPSAPSVSLFPCFSFFHPLFFPSYRCPCVFFPVGFLLCLGASRSRFLKKNFTISLQDIVTHEIIVSFAGKQSSINFEYIETRSKRSVRFLFNSARKILPAYFSSHCLATRYADDFQQEFQHFLTGIYARRTGNNYWLR